MLHKPAAPSGHDPAAAYKARLGQWMFLIYALIYAGFVFINVFNPLMMETRVLMGLSLAVVYGFGLIVLALIMALIYSSLCSRQELELSAAVDDEGSPSRE